MPRTTRSRTRCGRPAPEATEELIDAVAATLPPSAVAAPSLLPGWTRGHVLTHLARNADAPGQPADLGPHRRGDPAVRQRRRPRRGHRGGRRPRRSPSSWPTCGRRRAVRRGGRRDARAGVGGAGRWRRAAPSPAARCPGAGCARWRSTTSTWAPATPPADWPEAFALRLLREVVGDWPAAERSPPLVLRATDLGRRAGRRRRRRPDAHGGRPARALPPG